MSLAARAVARRRAREELTRSAIAEVLYKGRASSFTIQVNGRIFENVAWSYESPYPAMAEIAGHIAFYPDRLDAI